MLSMDFIRENPDKVKAAVRDKRGGVNVDELLALDAQRRDLLHQVEDLRSEHNAASKSIGPKKKAGEDLAATFKLLGDFSDRIKGMEARLGDLQRELDARLLHVPNCPSDATPEGTTPEANVVRRAWGEPQQFGFEPRPHWDLAKTLGLIDFERASKLSGAGFALFTNLGARLQRGLINFMLDLHTAEHGYTEVWPPAVVNRASMTGTGQLPKMEEDMYHCEVDDLFLIPTAEVPVTNIHREEILDGERLPICYTAYTPCFRREAGSYGKDTRGLIRVHQFDKVELVKFVRPETSYAELDKLTANAEAVLQRLGLAYRVLELCRGDLSFASAKTYDLEIWAPGVKRWLEVSSCSNFEDFQARRAGIRFRDKGQKPRFVHTLNGSGVALARLVLTILEAYQQPDGTVVIPEVLRPYMRGVERIAPQE
ncbi:MAG TPA: serine--tRNA ligase [Planctomycetota bacterium]|nr:serine--tRNA ligase [Planctomycetota bacterium]